MKNKNRKNELLNFIKWKCSYRDDIEKLLKSLSKLSYANLREWAIRNDIID